MIFSYKTISNWHEYDYATTQYINIKQSEDFKMYVLKGQYKNCDSTEITWTFSRNIILHKNYHCILLQN